MIFEHRQQETCYIIHPQTVDSPEMFVFTHLSVRQSYLGRSENSESSGENPVGLQQVLLA